MMADAYTLAGSLVEDHTNPDSMVTCWGMARENATQLRPQLPLEVWDHAQPRVPLDPGLRLSGRLEETPGHPRFPRESTGFGCLPG